VAGIMELMCGNKGRRTGYLTPTFPDNIGCGGDGIDSHDGEPASGEFPRRLLNGEVVEGGSEPIGWV